MKFRVIDLETSGLPEDREKGKKVGICEIGWTDVSDQLEISLPQARYANPGHPIPPEYRAVHHISDDDVRDAMRYEQACATLMEGMEPGDIFAAHHMKFERSFFGGGAHQWICTMNCAKHIWEEAPNHGNQVLRYWLNVQEELAHPELANPPHRSGPDTYVTAHILRRMLLERSSEQLVGLSLTPIILKYVRFGKYEGKLWSEMDEGFLDWITKRDFSEEVMHTARYWLRQKRTKAGLAF